MEVKFGFFLHTLSGLGMYDVTQFHTADIKQWYVKEGDCIKNGDLICNFDHDKGSMDLPSLQNGTIKKLNYVEGEKWERGADEETPFGVLFTPELGIIEIEEGIGTNKEQTNEPASAAVPKKSAEELQPEEPKKRKVHITAVAQKMMRETGLTIEDILRPFPDKTNIEKEDIVAYHIAKLREIEIKIRESVNQVIETRKEAELGKQKSAEETAPIVSQREREFVRGALSAVPAARRLAKERDIDLASVKGSGKEGIITVEDIEKIRAPERIPPQISPLVPANFGNAERVIRAPEIRKKIALFLTKSKLWIPHAGDEITIDITAFKEKRDSVKDFWERTYGTELKYDHFIMFFTAKHILQKEFSVLNGYWDWGADEKNVLEAFLTGDYSALKPNIILPPHVNLGIAVQTPDGLVVPVVHSAEKMGFADFARAANQKVKQALSRSLAITDLRDLTVTVNRVAFFDETRGEVVGGERPEVIIPYTVGINGERPTSFILAFGKIKEENGRKLLTVVFRFDHRITDGAIPLRFVYALKDFLEKDCANTKKFAEIITT